MENAEKEASSSLDKHTAEAEVQMTDILTKVKELQQDPDNDSTDKIHRLQQEYNRRVEEEADRTRRTLHDPLRVLPPELWKDIMPGTVEEVLVLTLVSSRWRDALTSIPFLWTNIALDGNECDYYARAVTCIHLSRPLEISLRIDIPIDVWRELAPQFTAESGRIRSLEILYPRETRFKESLEIFAFFHELPVLRTAKLPFRSWYSIYDYPGFVYPNPSAFEGINSLVWIRSFSFSVPMLRNPTFTNLETVNIRHFSKEVAQALGQLPHLKWVLLSQGHLPESFSDIPTSMQGCLQAVTKFSFWGHSGIRYHSSGNALALDQALLCVGQNLTQIFAGPVNIYSLPDLLASFQRFPHLTDIQFDVEHGREKFRTVNSETYTICCLPALQKLNLYFRVPSPLDSPPTDYQRDEAIKAQEKAFGRLFFSLIAMAPAVEELGLQGDWLASISLEYTKSLHSLRSLAIAPNIKRYANPSSYEARDERGKQTWARYVPPVKFLDHVSHNSLRSLRVSTAAPPPHLSPLLDETLGGYRVVCPRYRISSKEIPSLTTLTLELDHPIRMDLTNLSNLESLTLIGHPCATWASDFFEELALQPALWPSLESIYIRGDYMEWDILVFMLQRRNLVVKSGLKRIASIKFDGDLPYKLMYPMSQLLRGLFPETLSLVEISIEEIANRLCNPEM